MVFSVTGPVQIHFYVLIIRGRKKRKIIRGQITTRIAGTSL